MTDNFYRFNPLQLDVLKEISNIGAGNAATALSQLLQRRVKMSVPKVRILAFDEVAELVGGAATIVAGVLLQVSGDLEADLLFLLPWSQARSFLKVMLGREVSLTIKMDELETSTLEEVGNILANSFLTALAHFVRMRLNPSVPALAVDMAGAVLNLSLAPLGEIGEQALVIDTEFLGERHRVYGYFLFIPGPEQLGKLFRALRVVSG